MMTVYSKSFSSFIATRMAIGEMKEEGCTGCIRTVTRNLVKSLLRIKFPKAENLNVLLNIAFEGSSTWEISPMWMHTFWV